MHQRLTICLILSASVITYAEEKPNPKPAPTGKTLTLPVTRDNWFSIVGPEADGNNGGATRLKFKSYQEFSLLDFDPALLKGFTIIAAEAHVKCSTLKEPLHRMTASTFSAEWVEGTSSSYKPEKGSSSFLHRQFPDVPWTVPGSDVCSVMLGQGGTFWRMADATPPDANGWQTIPVDPRVIAARVAGISYGVLLFDDTGSEWEHQGEKFTLRHFPNRFIHSRESGKANAPYFTVTLGPKDETAPGKAVDFEASTAHLPAGESLVHWKTPADAGSGTIGFIVEVDGKAIPRYLIPFAGKPGERVQMHLRDLNIPADKQVKLVVKAVDAAGNVGDAYTTHISVSDIVPTALPGKMPTPFTDTAALPKLGKGEVAIIDELDKVHPISGEMIPKQAEGYPAANHLWSAKEQRLRLHAAGNEFVSFQISLRGVEGAVTPSLTFENAEGVKTAFGIYTNVESAKGPLPDPIVPLTKEFKVPEGHKNGSIHGEVYIPHALKPGDYRGKLLLKTEADTLEIAVDLHVWDFTLPDSLNFYCEMNGYGLPAGLETAYYRVGHRHRTSVNIVPYSQSGKVHDGWGPKWDGAKFDWTAWDARFAPYFDGSAFADLPRKSVPLDIFYLPLHENWPTPLAPNYDESSPANKYWADKVFKESYRKNFVEASRQFAEHFNEKGWHKTFFQCFFNDKLDFKAKGWSRTPTVWILDEPANFQDFWALHYFAVAFHEGIGQVRGGAEDGLSGGHLPADVATGHDGWPARLQRGWHCSAKL